MGSLNTVGGDMTIETTGSGTFDVSGADVEGDTSLTTDGYTEVDAATAGGETAVTMLNSEATMEVTLPDGAFPRPIRSPSASRSCPAAAWRPSAARRSPTWKPMPSILRSRR